MIFRTLLKNSKLLKTFLVMKGSQYMNILLRLMLNTRKLGEKMTLPPEILGFKLLRKAKITKEEKILVLTGMNNKNQQTLYKEAKQSLKKFKDERIHEKEKTISLKPAFFTQKPEALLASGFVRKSTQQKGGNFGNEKKL